MDCRRPCSSLFPRICSNSCPLSQWCHPTILSSVVPFSSCLSSFPATGSFTVSWFFAYKRNCTKWGLFCLVSSTERKVFKVHLYCSTCQHFISFHSWIIFCSVHTHFLHLSTLDGYLGCFYLLAIVNSKLPWTFLYKFLFEHLFSIILSLHLGVEWVFNMLNISYIWNTHIIYIYKYTYLLYIYVDIISM